MPDSVPPSHIFGHILIQGNPVIPETAGPEDFATILNTMHSSIIWYLE
jgi:hypothetical protein